MRNINDNKADDVDSVQDFEFNEPVKELEGLITSSGQALTTNPPVDNDFFQSAKAASIYAAGGDGYTDSGVANAYVLGVIGTKKAPPDFFDMMRARFLAGNTNTGASTINVATLGVKSIKLEDGTTDIAAGDIVVGELIELTYNTSNGVFLLKPSPVTFASQAEQETGTATDRVVSPSVQQFHPSAASAWVNFDASGVVTIKDDDNVTSITDNATNDYTVNVTNDFATTNYAYATAGEDPNGADGDLMINRPNGGTKTVSACRFKIASHFGGAGEPPEVCILFFGDLA